MRISDWSSDVCSSDLRARGETGDRGRHHPGTACHRASVDTGLFQRTARPRRDDGARPRRARQETLMETRSNNVLVGAFVLFFTIAIAIFVVWMATDRDRKSVV